MKGVNKKYFEGGVGIVNEDRHYFEAGGKKSEIKIELKE